MLYAGQQITYVRNGEVIFTLTPETQVPFGIAGLIRLRQPFVSVGSSLNIPLQDDEHGEEWGELRSSLVEKVEVEKQRILVRTRSGSVYQIGYTGIDLGLVLSDGEGRGVNRAKHGLPSFPKNKRETPSTITSLEGRVSAKPVGTKTLEERLPEQDKVPGRFYRNAEAMCLWAAGAAIDAVTTVYAMDRYGTDIELNPIARTMFNEFGAAQGATLLKAGGFFLMYALATWDKLQNDQDRSRGRRIHWIRDEDLSFYGGAALQMLASLSNIIQLVIGDPGIMFTP